MELVSSNCYLLVALALLALLVFTFFSLLRRFVSLFYLIHLLEFLARDDCGADGARRRCRTHSASEVAMFLRLFGFADSSFLEESIEFAVDIAAAIKY